MLDMPLSAQADTTANVPALYRFAIAILGNKRRSQYKYILRPRRTRVRTFWPLRTLRPNTGACHDLVCLFPFPIPSAVIPHPSDMDFIPPPPTSPEPVDLSVPAPLPPSPTLWQDISSSDLSYIARPRSPTRVPLPPPITAQAPPPIVIFEPPRGRSRSRSYSPPFEEFTCTRPARSSRRYSYVSPSRSRSRSRTPSPCRYSRRRPSSYRPRSVSPSLERRYSFHVPPPPPPMFYPPLPPPPIFVCPPRTPTPIPPPTVIIPGPCMTPQPVSPVTGLPYEPVDIVTFNYNKDMAYAPAAKTYDVRSFPFHPSL